MSMLEDIKAAEKAADELKKEKTAAARTLLRDAQEEARKEADALVAKAREAAQKTVSEAEAKAHKEADAFVAQKAEEDRQKAEAARLDNAVKYIMEKVVIEC